MIRTAHALRHVTMCHNWVILVHPEDRHYFAFTIAWDGQLQPIRMPQGTMSAAFSMTELMYITLGEIPAAVNFDRMP